MANAIAYQKNSLEIQNLAVEVLAEVRSRSTYSSLTNFLFYLLTHIPVMTTFALVSYFCFSMEAVL
jgi:hypothetical protein